MLILATFLVFAAAWFLVAGVTVKQREVAVALRRARRYGTRNQREIETSKDVNERIVGPLLARMASLALRVAPRTSTEAIRARLMSAGLARTMPPQTFLALKAGCALSPVALGLVVLLTGVIPRPIGLIVAAGGGVLGFIAPEFFVKSRIRGRQESMQAELPKVLDMLCVSVEAGLGFDQALSKLSERMEGPLVDEFALVLHEMRVGATRATALRNLAERVDVPEISQFTRALIQADQLGIALSRILRVQSADMRLRRQLAAEEKAMKAPVKMLFPTVLFIFPSLFVVVLGPAVLALVEAFSA
jgi:tight adherence protein C